MTIRPAIFDDRRPLRDPGGARAGGPRRWTFALPRDMTPEAALAVSFVPGTPVSVAATE
jgi:hypothetical protein